MALVLATLNYPPEVGGVENLCLQLARGLGRAGVTVLVLAPRVPGDAAFDDTEPYEVVRFATGKLPRVIGLSLAVERLLLRRKASDDALLFAQWTAAPAMAARQRVVGRPRTMATLVHGKEMLVDRDGYRNSAFFQGMRRLVLGQASHVIAVSRYTADLCRQRGAPPDRVHVMNPGVDAEQFTPVPNPQLPALVAGSEGPYLVTVARLVPRKGVDTMIAALPAIRQAFPGVRYLVGGSGADRDRLESLARQFDVGEAIHFLGRVPDGDLTSLYSAADIKVMASRQDLEARDVEGFGLVLLEAQACGTPVIAANSGGMPDALVPDETGLLVPPDDPAALAEAVIALLSDPERLAKMGLAARAHAERQTWDQVASRLSDILGLG